MLKSIEIGASKVVVTIASTPTDYVLYLNSTPRVLGENTVSGERQIPASINTQSNVLSSTREIDIDYDAQKEIRVTLISLTATHAELNFVSLVPASPTTHLLGLSGVGG